MSTNKRITFVVGAGAPLDLSLPDTVICPSTNNITSEVLKPYNNYLDPGNPITIVQNIYDVLVGTYPAKIPSLWESEPTKPNINFEQLFHVLEMLVSYSGVWGKNAMHPICSPFLLHLPSQTLVLTTEIFIL